MIQARPTQEFLDSLRLERLPESGPEAPAVQGPVLEYAPVVAHAQVAPEYWLITLRSRAMAERAQPAQFAMLTLARDEEVAPVLPRPMALYD